MAFPFGRPMLLLLSVALTTGFWAARPASSPSDLTLWTFSEQQAQVARSVLSGAVADHQLSVSIESMSDRVENLRLQSIFLDPPTDRSVVPDIVEIEIGQLGRFFRPPVEQIGLSPLNARMSDAGMIGKFLPARLATWSKDGVVFGLPMDVHPVALAYRDDLFRQAGVDLEAVQTWSELQEAGLRYQAYWREHGCMDRWAAELSRSSSDGLSILIAQQRMNLIDPNGKPQINDSLVTQTLAFYARLVAGPKRIGLDSGVLAAESQDILAGRVALFMMPDWRLHEFKGRYPELAGLMRVRSLPRFSKNDAPTASWGGTMLGIPRAAPHPDAAWKIIQQLTLSPQANSVSEQQEILSAIPSQWENGPHVDHYFSDEDVHALFVRLAEVTPVLTVNPQTVIARAELSVALSAAIAQVDHGRDQNLLDDCQRWLDWAAADLSNRLAQERLKS